MNSADPGGRELAARAEDVLRRRDTTLSAATQDQYSSALAAAQAELEREAHAETTLATVTIPLRLRETRVGRAVIDQRVLGVLASEGLTLADIDGEEYCRRYRIAEIECYPVVAVQRR